MLRASLSRPVDTTHRFVALVLVALVLAGCVHTGPAPRAAGYRVAETAQKMVGVPYRFGGSTPRGFDCSGLAQYAYAAAGIEIPRVSTDQFRASRPVLRHELAAGDLLFFDTDWRRGHVGIYIGDGRFVHAPSSGGRVSVEGLNGGYYKGRLVRIGRF